MPNDKPKLEDLYELFNLKTPAKIVGSIINNAKSKEAELYDNIINTGNSFKTCSELDSIIKGIGQQCTSYYREGDQYCTILSEKFNDEDTTTEKFTFLDRSLRDTSNLDLFFNGIPTIELAKLTPYLNIKFLINIHKDNLNNTTQLSRFPSLENFLTLGFESTDVVQIFNSSKIKSSDSEEFRNITNIKVGLDKKNSYFITDESLYSAPSTLSNNFKPFLSLKKVDIKVTPTVDYAIAFEDFNLSMVLHDRKNMNKFPHLFGVEYRNDIYAIIEYGWSHPDDTAIDHYAYFFNKILRKKTVCQLTNASYNFDDIGQVNIEMKLHTIGAAGMYVNTFFESADVLSAEKALRDISNQIKKFTNKYDVPPSLQGSQLLRSLSSGNVVKYEQKDDEILKKLIETLKKVDVVDKKSLVDLEKNIADFKKEFKKNKKVEAVNNIIKAQFDSFSKWQKDYREKLKYKIEKDDMKDGDTYLHEIFTYFVSRQLLELEKEYVNEVQFIYYNFGSNTIDNIKNESIGKFKIFKDDLKNVLLNTKELKSYTIERFIKLVLTKFVDDLKTPYYGFADRNSLLYSGDVKTSKNVSANIDKTIAEKLKKYQSYGDFKKPKVTFRVDCINKIIRIHVFDQTRVFKLDPQKKVSDLVKGLLKTKKEIKKLESKKIKTGQDLTEIGAKIDNSKKTIAEIQNYNVQSLSFNDLKSQYKALYPIIDLDGTSTTMVKSFQLSTAIDPQITTSRIKENLDLIENSINTGNSPDPRLEELYTRVVPGKITMQTVGFPIADVHQTFFIDLYTGTDVDNLYCVSSVNHSIEPGSFKTNFELMNQDSFGSYTNLIYKVNHLDAITNVIQIEDPTKKPKKASGPKGR